MIRAVKRSLVAATFLLAPLAAQAAPVGSLDATLDAPLAMPSSQSAADYSLMGEVVSEIVHRKKRKCRAGFHKHGSKGWHCKDHKKRKAIKHRHGHSSKSKPRKRSHKKVYYKQRSRPSHRSHRSNRRHHNVSHGDAIKLGILGYGAYRLYKELKD